MERFWVLGICVDEKPVLFLDASHRWTKDAMKAEVYRVLRDAMTAADVIGNGNIGIDVIAITPRIFTTVRRNDIQECMDHNREMKADRRRRD